MLRKILIPCCLLLLTHSSVRADFNLGSPASETPYEEHMQPVRLVLQALRPAAASMQRVEELMRIGRKFRYRFTDPYTPASPAVTAKTHAGDCKAKALWLCEQIGDEHVRFVIGKASARSQLSHAWVIWKNQGRWWILDCTRQSQPIAADRVAKDEYLPLYSYGKAACYRHSTREPG